MRYNTNLRFTYLLTYTTCSLRYATSLVTVHQSYVTYIDDVEPLLPCKAKYSHHFSVVWFSISDCIEWYKHCRCHSRCSGPGLLCLQEYYTRAIYQKIIHVKATKRKQKYSS